MLTGIMTLIVAGTVLKMVVKGLKRGQARISRAILNIGIVIFLARWILAGNSFTVELGQQLIKSLIGLFVFCFIAKCAREV